jgi:Fe-S cluster assembly ATP-binding protein
MLNIKNLIVSINDKKLFSGLNLETGSGDILILRGKNGIGKSTLASAIMADAKYLASGEISFNGTDISKLNTTARALLGIYYAQQNVPEIPGLSISSFLKHSMQARATANGAELNSVDFFKALNNATDALSIPKEWLARSVNVGFSGGEKKRLALLSLTLATPKLAILDEIEAGADKAMQKLTADTINKMNENGTAFLIISHQDGFISELKNGKEIQFEDLLK